MGPPSSLPCSCFGSCRAVHIDGFRASDKGDEFGACGPTSCRAIAWFDWKRKALIATISSSTEMSLDIPVIYDGVARIGYLDGYLHILSVVASISRVSGRSNEQRRRSGAQRPRPLRPHRSSRLVRWYNQVFFCRHRSNCDIQRRETPADRLSGEMITSEPSTGGFETAGNRRMNQVSVPPKPSLRH